VDDEVGVVVAVVDGVVVDIKDTGLTPLTVGQSDAAEEETGLSLRDVVELVSDMWGEYLRWRAGLLLALLSMVRTRLALLAATTLAVLMTTGEEAPPRARTGVAATRPSVVVVLPASGMAATGFEDITAVEG
jgi:hypothetical protein